MSGLTTSIYCWWDLYSGRNEHNKNIPIDAVINDLKGSGFTTVIAWSVHVNTSGDLIYNDTSIVSGGKYIGDSGWSANLAALKQGKTSVNRLLFSIGSGPPPRDFTNIQALIKKQGTGTNSILYKNFKALKDAIPAIDGIDLDDEDCYDQNMVVQLSQMLNTLGYKVTFCPYTNPTFWVDSLYALNSQTPGLVVGFNLQCYSGGGGNDPQTWINAIAKKMGSGFDAKGFIYPGLCASNKDGDAGGGLSPDQITTQFTKWRTAGIQGGWIWRYDHIKNFGKYTAADYANAIVKGLPGTPVYLYATQNPSRYYYTTNPADSPGPDWSRSGIAFIAFGSGTVGVIPVRQHSAGNPQRYSYDITGTLAPGWTDDNKTSFYAYKSQTAGTVPVYQYHTLLPGEFWNMFYSLDPNVSGWIKDGVAFYVYGA